MTSREARVGNRVDVREATLVHLTERFNDREVFLVGTMNKSTLLAHRTKKLIEDVKPDQVLVQASPEWWKVARLLRFVDNQEEFDRYGYAFKNVDKFTESLGLLKGPIQYSRLWIGHMLWRWSCGWGYGYDPLKAGLETKYACEAALDTGSELKFLGGEFDQPTRYALLTEKGIFNIFSFAINKFFQFSSLWGFEHKQHKVNQDQVGMKSWIEGHMDQYMCNWFIKSTELFFPGFKNIMVDWKDEQLFKQIDRTEGKRIVVLVNQWHMEGIEHNWCHAYGQNPRSVEFPEGINPIGDMELRTNLFDCLYNALQRQIKSANARSTPASFTDMITPYHRESVFHYEHRDM